MEGVLGVRTQQCGAARARLFPLVAGGGDDVVDQASALLSVPAERFPGGAGEQQHRDVELEARPPPGIRAPRGGLPPVARGGAELVVAHRQTADDRRTRAGRGGCDRGPDRIGQVGGPCVDQVDQPGIGEGEAGLPGRRGGGTECDGDLMRRIAYRLCCGCGKVAALEFPVGAGVGVPCGGWYVLRSQRTCFTRSSLLRGMVKQDGRLDLRR